MRIVFAANYNKRLGLKPLALRPVPMLFIVVGMVIPSVYTLQLLWTGAIKVDALLTENPLFLHQSVASVITGLTIVVVYFAFVCPLHELVHRSVARALGFQADFMPPLYTLRRTGSFAVAVTGDMSAQQFLAMDLAPLVILTPLATMLCWAFPPATLSFVEALLGLIVASTAAGNTLGAIGDLLLAGLVCERYRDRRVKGDNGYTVYDP